MISAIPAMKSTYTEGSPSIAIRKLTTMNAKSISMFTLASAPIAAIAVEAGVTDVLPGVDASTPTAAVISGIVLLAVGWLRRVLDRNEKLQAEREEALEKRIENLEGGGKKQK